MSQSKAPAIKPKENGPLFLINIGEITAEDGSAISIDKKSALCRCGKSSDKPFCDGTHAKGGFSSIREGSEDDRRLTFPGEPITFFENVALCSHAGLCLKGKPDEWRERGDYTDEELVGIVRKCPSGALSYARGDVEYRDQERPPSIKLVEGGPIQIEGGIALQDTDWPEGASREHYTLCRCGLSKLKPFCDGSHDQLKDT